MLKDQVPGLAQEGIVEQLPELFWSTGSSSTLELENEHRHAHYEAKTAVARSFLELRGSLHALIAQCQAYPQPESWSLCMGNRRPVNIYWFLDLDRSVCMSLAISASLVHLIDGRIGIRCSV